MQLWAQWHPAAHASRNDSFAIGATLARTIDDEIYRANLMIKMQAASLFDLVRMALIAGILGSTGVMA